MPVCLLLFIISLISAVPALPFSNQSEFKPTDRVSVEKCTILNKGKGGDSSFEMLNRIQEDIIQESPDMVFLSIGMNDMINLEKFVDYHTFEKNYQKIIDHLKGHPFEVVLLNLVPVDTIAVKVWYKESLFHEKPQDKIKKANLVIQKLAARNGLPLIDLYNAFVTENGKEEHTGKLIMNKGNSGTDDGVHLTRSGYQLIAGKLFDYLTRNEMQVAKKRYLFLSNLLGLEWSSYHESMMNNLGSGYPLLDTTGLDQGRRDSKFGLRINVDMNTIKNAIYT